MMKYVVPVVVLTFVLSACVGNDPSSIVKSARLSPDVDYTYEQWFNEMAGVTGTVDWDSFTPSESANENIRIVEVEMKNEENGVPIEVLVQFEVNTNTEQFQWGYSEVNGEPSGNVFTFTTALLEVGVETLEAGQ